MASERESPPDDGEKSRATVSRRSYLLLAGSAIATGATAGCLGGGDDDTRSLPRQLRPVKAVFGFGGTTVTSIQTSSLSGASSSLTATTETEPNDDRAAATPVSVGSAVSADLESSGLDWFAFDVAAGQTVNVTLDRSVNSGITSLVLYGPGGEYADLVYVGNEKPATVDVDGAAVSGTYYAQVVDVQNGAGSYELRISDGSSTTTTDTTTSTPTTTTETTTTSTPTTTTTSTTTTATATPTTTTDETPEYGEQSYGEYGYGGILQ